MIFNKDLYETIKRKKERKREQTYRYIRWYTHIVHVRKYQRPYISWRMHQIAEHNRISMLFDPCSLQYQHINTYIHRYYHSICPTCASQLSTMLDCWYVIDYRNYQSYPPYDRYYRRYSICHVLLSEEKYLLMYVYLWIYIYICT